jgi:nucleoside-triphosphatase THEP1
MNKDNEKKTARIYVMTGNVHTGKTTLLKKACAGLKQKGLRLSGLLSISLYSGDQLQGYDGYDLATETSFPLARTEAEKNRRHIGRFFFSPSGREKAEKALLRPGAFDLTVVDELGPLELYQSAGFLPPVNELLRLSRDLLLVIRKPLLPEFARILPLPDIIFDISEPDLSQTMIRTIFNKAEMAR